MFAVESYDGGQIDKMMKHLLKNGHVVISHGKITCRVYLKLRSLLHNVGVLSCLRGSLLTTTKNTVNILPYFFLKTKYKWPQSFGTLAHIFLHSHLITKSRFPCRQSFFSGRPEGWTIQGGGVFMLITHIQHPRRRQQLDVLNRLTCGTSRNSSAPSPARRTAATSPSRTSYRTASSRMKNK